MIPTIRMCAQYGVRILVVADNHYLLTSPPLPKGKTTLMFKFNHHGNFSGTGEMYVNDKKVGTVDMPTTHQSTYSLSEPFDVGRDNGTQVSRQYKGFFPFEGDLDKVVFKLFGDVTKEEQMESNEAVSRIKQVD